MVKPKFEYGYKNEDHFEGTFNGIDIWRERNDSYHCLYANDQYSTYLKKQAESVVMSNKNVDRLDRVKNALALFFMLKNDPSVSPNSK